jgi:hypothetical protein
MRMDTAPAAVAAIDAACPRCQKPLVDPKGLGWCQACGYCRSLDEDRARLTLQPETKTQTEVAIGGSGAAPTRFPIWVLVLLAGILVLAAGSWAAGHYLHLKPLHRALWTSAQIGGGILVMFLGQCYGLLHIAPEEASLHFHDAIIPFRLYGLVCNRLPRMAVVLCIGSWGLALTLSALIFIGGLSHLLIYLPKSRESQQLQGR